jgi:hypothetical protein
MLFLFEGGHKVVLKFSVRLISVRASFRDRVVAKIIREILFFPRI